MCLASLPALAATLLLGALMMPGAARAQAVAEPTPTEVAYLAATGPYRDRLGMYQERLLAHQQAAAEGQLDSIAITDLGDLTRELFAARLAFTGAVPSVRLDRYDRTMQLALDRAYEATVLLVRAHVTESLPDHDALIREAEIQTASSVRLLTEAADELRTVVPVTIP